MRPPLIGITCGTKQADKGPQDRLNQAYSNAVVLGGGLPVIIPNLESGAATAFLDRLDGLLLSGGADVAPEKFGESILSSTVEVDSARDSWELPLIRAALEGKLPILAICRGIQSLNVALGGSLYQDLPEQNPTSIAHRQNASRDTATHDIRVCGGSLLARIADAESIPVNSFHHQAIKELAEGLIVTAEASDGIIEAVEAGGGRFLIGVQYHPEELVRSHEHARKLFEAFVQAASR